MHYDDKVANSPQRQNSRVLNDPLATIITPMYKSFEPPTCMIDGKAATLFTYTIILYIHVNFKHLFVW